NKQSFFVFYFFCNASRYSSKCPLTKQMLHDLEKMAKHLPREVEQIKRELKPICGMEFKSHSFNRLKKKHRAKTLEEAWKMQKWEEAIAIVEKAKQRKRRG